MCNYISEAVLSYCGLLSSYVYIVYVDATLLHFMNIRVDFLPSTLYSCQKVRKSAISIQEISSHCWETSDIIPKRKPVFKRQS